MRLLFQEKYKKNVTYVELPLPESVEMNGLWTFLRNGGFSHHTSTVEDVTGRKPIDFADFLDKLINDLMIKTIIQSKNLSRKSAKSIGFLPVTSSTVLV